MRARFGAADPTHPGVVSVFDCGGLTVGDDRRVRQTVAVVVTELGSVAGRADEAGDQIALGVVAVVVRVVGSQAVIRIGLGRARGGRPVAPDIVVQIVDRSDEVAGRADQLSAGVIGMCQRLSGIADIQVRCGADRRGLVSDCATRIEPGLVPRQQRTAGGVVDSIDPSGGVVVHGRGDGLSDAETVRSSGT